MLCSKILLTISGKLQDLSEPKRWQWENVNPDAPSLLDYLNNAVAQIVSVRPDATAVTTPIVLAKGFKQSIPANAGSLINILYNTNADGAVGKYVRQTKFKSIITLPSQEGTVVDCYAYDKLDDPKSFWVYPHVPDAGLVVMGTVSAKPTPITSVSSDFPLADEYISPAVHWVLYEIYGGDNTDTDLLRATHQYESFMQELGSATGSAMRYPVKPKAGNG